MYDFEASKITLHRYESFVAFLPVWNLGSLQVGSCVRLSSTMLDCLRILVTVRISLVSLDGLGHVRPSSAMFDCDDFDGL